MSSRVSILVLFLLVPLLEGPLQAQAVENSLGNLLNSVNAFADTRPPQTEQERRLVILTNEMRTTIAILGNGVQMRAAAPGFIESLDLDTEALKGVRTAPLDRALVVVGAVADDIRVKARYVGALPGLNQIADVPVTAMTKSGNQERPGYEVWYVPSALENNQSKYKRFPLNSSPTNHLLAPGAYLMWSQSQQGAKGARKPVDVGNDGQKQNLVDLPVP